MNASILKILVIILAGSGMGLLTNFFNSNGLSILKPVKETSVENNPENIDESKDEFSEPKTIKAESAIKLFNSGAIFIDARDNEDYIAGHIKNSINIPYYDFDNYAHHLNNISKTEVLVTYCSGTDCDLSIMLANKLFKMGYKKIFIFFGGWNDWQNSGYPVEGTGLQ